MQPGHASSSPRLLDVGSAGADDDSSGAQLDASDRPVELTAGLAQLTNPRAKSLSTHDSPANYALAIHRKSGMGHG
jgi:hypothetical protein